jgi:hypothetical protein
VTGGGNLFGMGGGKTVVIYNHITLIRPPRVKGAVGTSINK